MCKQKFKLKLLGVSRKQQMSLAAQLFATHLLKLF